MDIVAQKNQKNYIYNLISLPFAFFCFLMPFEEVLAGSFGSVLKLIGIALIFLAVCSVRELYFSSTWVPLLIWLAYCGLTALWARSFEWWSYFFQIYVSQVAFAFVLGQLPSQVVNLKTVKWGLMAGATVASAILVLSPETSTYIEGRRTIMMFGSKMDPNILSAVLIMGFYATLALRYADNGNGKKIRKIICYLCAVVIIAGILYTGSRGGIVALIISVTAGFLLLQRRDMRMKKGTVIWIAASAVVIVILMLLFIPEDYLASRFSWENIFGLNDYKSGSHNRYTIWLRAWVIFKRNPFIGYGCGNFFNSIATVYRECAAHNIIVLSFVEYGIIGSIPLFIFLFFTVRDVYRSKNIIAMSMLIAIFVVSLTLDSLPYKYFWVTIVLSHWEADASRVLSDGGTENG